MEHHPSHILEHATDVIAGLGLLQFFFLPALIPWLQAIFLIVSIIWICTQMYFKFKKGN